MANGQATPFGELLQRYRAAARLTQQELAARAHLSPDAVAALERGRRRAPRAATTHLLAAALDLTDEERAALLIAAGAAARPPGSIPAAGARAWTTQGAPSAAPPTVLIGRVDELATIRQRLVAEGTRLLTLTGPAGVGKTRLAVEAAALLASRFPDGVMLVDLAPIRDPPLVLSAIAHALGLADTGGRPVLDRLATFLRGRTALLVLDNFEQALPAAAALADLLAACTGLTLLVTSRVPLHVRWEQTLRIPPLAAPALGTTLPPLDELAQVPAVALFVERARDHQADFALTTAQAPLVAQLATQLDGLPLALELAASRLDALPLPLIVRRLGDRLRLLRWDAPDLPERQRSLEAAVGWSYDLLSAGERRLFRHLGVFVGRVALDALADVVGGAGGEGDGGNELGTEHFTLEGLASLAEKSLVLPAHQTGEEDAECELCYGMLETVREYAREQLTRHGELEAAQHAHAHYFLALAEQANLQLRKRGQRAWFFRLEREHDNLRTALRWLLDQDDPAEHEAALRLAGALGWFWWLRGYHVEGWRWLEEALGRGPGADAAVRARALLGAGRILTLMGEFEQARAVLEEALALARRRHDTIGVAQALTEQGACAAFASDWAESTQVLREALHRWEGLGDAVYSGLALYYLGIAVAGQGDDAEAAALEADALVRFEAAGAAREAGGARFYIAVIVGRRGDLSGAARHMRVGLEASVALQDRRLLSIGAQAALTLLGERTDPAQCARLVGACDALVEATGAPPVWTHVTADRGMAALRGRIEREGWGTAYREGELLPFSEVVALILTLVEVSARTLAHPDLSETGSCSSREQPSHQESPLSERERAVLRLVAEGLSNKAIGRQLFISASTVNYHLTSVFHKLCVDTRAQAVAVAGRRNLL
jgi:predicted ATPase/DNA-binding CsgD family transcriptional regulator/transcriptional regulator with XRE-family HTH domain